MLARGEGWRKWSWDGLNIWHAGENVQKGRVMPKHRRIRHPASGIRHPSTIA